jgi:protein-S-isoprenylcysteine O-methyltransferase Ste14
MEFLFFAALAAGTCFIQLMSIFFVFKKVESTTNPFYRFFQFQFWAVWITFFYFYFNQEKPATVFLATSSVIIVAGLGLFFYCSSLIRQRKLTIVFSKDSPEFHLSKGPYAYVRHPFYTSYIGTYAALALVNQNWICSALSCSMFLTYFFAARYEEKKFLNSNFKDSYASYMQTTGMFFPIPFIGKATPLNPSNNQDHNPIKTKGA